MLAASRHLNALTKQQPGNDSNIRYLIHWFTYLAKNSEFSLFCVRTVVLKPSEIFFDVFLSFFISTHCSPAISSWSLTFTHSLQSWPCLVFSVGAIG